ITAPLAISRLEVCEACSGSGAAKGSQPRGCTACGGRGRQRFSQGFLVVTRPCATCGGEGRIVDKPCSGCGGEGRRRATRTAEIRLRGRGFGRLGRRGRGDLVVRVTVIVPDAPSQEEKDLLRQYAEATGAPVEAPGVFSKAKKIFK